jgi:hypothetical protein
LSFPAKQVSLSNQEPSCSPKPISSALVKVEERILINLNFLMMQKRLMSLSFEMEMFLFLREVSTSEKVSSDFHSTDLKFHKKRP